MDKDLITSILGITIAWVSITGLINIMLYISVYKENPIFIKLPKSKKFKNDRLSPIYQIKEGTFNDYVISKYNLDWKLVFPLFVINLFFIPFILLEFHKYCYVLDEQTFGISTEDLSKMTETLGEYYERNYKESKTLSDIYIKEYEIINHKINNLNKSFNENYGK